MLYGIGNPLMDIIVRASHESLARLGVVPGSMNLVDYDRQLEAVSSGSVVRRLPGGSCANTVRGVRWLLEATGAASVRLYYTGAVGSDRTGDAFETLLDTEGVVPVLARKHTPTGSSVILVTPDSQRTMFTYLGACRDLDTRDVDLQRARTARVLHTTGYMWDTQNQEAAARRAVAAARAGHTIVSFDVADPFVVHRSFDSLVGWIPGNVDVLFANDEELQALTGTRGPKERVLRAAAAFAPTVAMKIGRRGCMVIHHGTVISADAYPAERVDTTGAGDAFAAGYLYGLLHGMGVATCAAIANIFAASIVSVDGCNYDALDNGRIRSAVEQASAAPSR